MYMLATIPGQTAHRVGTLADDPVIKHRFREVARVYLSFSRAKARTDKILDLVSEEPEIEEANRRLIDLANQIEDLEVARSGKTAPVNIGAEERKKSDQLDNAKRADELRMRRAMARKMARPLFSRYHPDKGGSVEEFHLIEKASEEGDVETIKFFLIQDGVGFYSEDDLVQLAQQIDMQYEMLVGGLAYGIARDYNMNRARCIHNYRAIIEQQIIKLTRQLIETREQLMRGKTNPTEDEHELEEEPVLHSENSGEGAWR